MPPEESDFLFRAAVPLARSPRDYDPLIARVGEARMVLLGEATHGTHEFYRERAVITKRLITEKGFHGVAVEADWPDAFRVHQYATGQGDDDDATEALSGFERFPTWMWRNADVLDFVGWLRAYNESIGPGEKIGFYGLDLYSLYRSIEAVLAYLDRNDPDAARRARYRYGCFEQFGEDSQAYGYAASFDLTRSCEEAAVRQLLELRTRALERLEAGVNRVAEEAFALEQNARVVKNAEAYYRQMFSGRVSTWNLRDRHMGDTLAALATHLDARVGRSKLVVWAHNSHVGDARATQMRDEGEVNLGQLVRERFGLDDTLLVGFTTYAGTVTAASTWGGQAERKRINPALDGSYEALFHHTGLSRFWLDTAAVDTTLLGPERRLERAIGVIYAPRTERISHYLAAQLTEQFDAILHIDETRAVEPLERTPRVRTGEAAETYPFSV